MQCGKMRSFCMCTSEQGGEGKTCDTGIAFFQFGYLQVATLLSDDTIVSFVGRYVL